jgi:hypothetical protein
MSIGVVVAFDKGEDEGRLGSMWEEYTVVAVMGNEEGGSLDSVVDID